LMLERTNVFWQNSVYPMIAFYAFAAYVLIGMLLYGETIPLAFEKRSKQPLKKIILPFKF